MSMTNRPTAINSFDKVKNTLSPIYVPITSLSTFTHVRLNLWVWTGNLQQPYDDMSEPTISLYQEKINYSDQTILFEISEYIRSYNKPSLIYDGDFSEINSGQVFFQWEATLINNPTNDNIAVGFLTQYSSTQLGILGYNYNYQSYNGFNFDFSFGVKSLDILNSDYRFINGASYFNASFKFYLGTEANSNEILSYFKITPEPNYCPKERYTIWYINQSGIWDYFTPTGKVLNESEIKRDTYNRTVTRPDLINPSQFHRVAQLNLEQIESWTINTGFMNERLGQIIEAIMVSPMVYLIQITDGVAPGTYISRQIPLVNNDTSFGRKTRLNNKGKISYQMKFKETTNKIQNIR